MKAILPKKYKCLLPWFMVYVTKNNKEKKQKLKRNRKGKEANCEDK
jgi:hypothetical protein